MIKQSDIAIYVLKLFVTNICVYLSFIKLSSSQKIRIRYKVIIIISNLVISLISANIYYINYFLSILILVISYSLILGLIEKTKVGYSLIIGIISYALTIACLGIAAILSYVPYILILNLTGQVNYYLNLIMVLGLEVILIYGFFKIKRFKKGFIFLRKKLNDDFTDIVMINISTILLLIYCLIGSYYKIHNQEILKDLCASFIVITITMIITIQRTFTMYYKQKLMKQTLEDYERELKEKDSEIERLKNEKFNISKITHEFYNRQKALEKSVKDSMNIEASEEVGSLDKIHNLTNEYSEKLKEIKGLPSLPLTEISEIDDMFKYMQEECDKDNIEFKLKIVGNIFYLINNIIPKNKLETMIGDHIRDAIIAINSSKTSNKEILVILGLKDGKYELCIYDTGIDFEIQTLLKLGLEPATTHKDIGGSGIGFITTFETLEETKASLIIREERNIYTKSVTIRFDNKNEYRIYSYRSDEIRKAKGNSKDYKNRKMIIENI